MVYVYASGTAFCGFTFVFWWICCQAKEIFLLETNFHSHAVCACAGRMGMVWDNYIRDTKYAISFRTAKFIHLKLNWNWSDSDFHRSFKWIVVSHVKIQVLLNNWEPPTLRRLLQYNAWFISLISFFYEFCVCERRRLRRRLREPSIDFIKIRFAL